MITLDVETTINNKGNPFDSRNLLVSVVALVNGNYQSWFREWSGLEELVKSSSGIIGFNIKFDLHWLRNVGVDFSHCEIWDCQYVEFLLSSQTNKYPSLEETAIKYELGHKIDVIKEEYWDKELDTLDVPKELLLEYNKHDVYLTHQIYLKQKEILEQNPQLYRLFKLHMMDLLVLQEMEWNGIKFDVQGSLEKAKEIETESDKCTKKLMDIAGLSCFDCNSNDHLSALLYGGTIVETIKLPIGVYKTGPKAGSQRFKNQEIIHTLPRIVEPLKGSEYKKGGVWSTDETTLSSMALTGPAKGIRDIILERRGLEKLNNTYLKGFPNKIKEMCWEENILHSTLNQVVASTGRLSSTNPNQQNLDKTTKQFCITRYDY